MKQAVWMSSAIVVCLALSAVAFAGPPPGAPGRWSALVPVREDARQFFVSPAGRAGGPGTEGDPWSLAYAMNGPGAVRPGDIIWLRGGTYNIVGTLNCRLTGTSARPIFVRQYPGERATLDTGDSSSNRIALNGAHTWYWGFEVTSSGTDRWGQDGLLKGGALDAYGAGIKLVNLAVHNTGGLVGFWRGVINGEVNGCIIFFNGYDDNARGHCHAIYTQNAAADNSTKWITDNIMFAQYSYGLHAYTEGGRIDNFVVEGNISFNNGVISTISGGTTQYLIGGRPIALNPVVRKNYAYANPSVSGLALNLGYGAGVQNSVVTDNYLVGRSTAMNLRENGAATITGNTFYGNVSGFTQAGFPANTYHGLTRPTGTHVFVRPNKYEPGRGHVAIYNWGNLATVDVDLSTILQVGDVYEVRDAENFFGVPVVIGVFDGDPVALPMDLTTTSPLIGAPARPYDHTPREFNAFVVCSPPLGMAYPPIANAGPDQTLYGVTGGHAQVTLDGTASWDPDGQIVSYHWLLNNVQIAGDPAPTVTLPVGTHTITLEVVDDDGATATDTVVVTIHDWIAFNLTVLSTPGTGVAIRGGEYATGTTNFSSWVRQGTQARLTAPAFDGAGRAFLRWQLDLVAQPARQRNLTVRMDRDRVAVAQYAAPGATNTYLLTVNASGAAGVEIGSQTGHGGTTAYAQLVAQKTTVNLCAPAYVGSGAQRKRFVRWIAGGSTTTNRSINLTMTGALAAVAEYADDPAPAP